MARKRSLYVVEPTADPAWALETIKDLSPGKTFVYCPQRFKQLEFKAILEQNRSRIELLPFETNYGPEADVLYGFCQDIAAVAKIAVPNDIQNAVWASLQDRLVARLRPAHLLSIRAKERGIERIVWLSPTPQIATPLWEALTATFAGVVSAAGPSPVRSTMSTIGSLFDIGKVRTFSPADVEAVIGRGRERPLIWMSIGFGDQQYRNNGLSLAKGLLSRYDVLVTPPAVVEGGASHFAFDDHDLRGFLANGRMRFMDRNELGARPPFDMAIVDGMRSASKRLARVEILCPSHDVHFSAYAKEMALQELPKIADDCAAIWPQVSSVMEVCAGTVTCPGRPLVSRSLVAAAKRQGKANFELQTGTISRSRRALKPAADHVLVMDHDSKKTYEFLGADGTIDVVGSLRLDYDLAKWRGISKEQARKQIGISDDADLWVMATQPIGHEKMGEVVRPVLEAASRKRGVTVLVKMHPSETEVYEEHYKDLAQEYPKTTVIVDRVTKSVLAAVAADVVLTHFSTVGMEAYALQRTSIAVNPFPEPLAFDLVRMEVAQPAMNSDEILAAVQRGWSANPSTRVLTDGKACERSVTIVAEAVADRASKRRPAKAKKIDAIKAPTAPPKPAGPIFETLKWGWHHLPAPIRNGLKPAARAIVRRIR